MSQLTACLEKLEGLVYRPPAADIDDGLLYANDNLVCFVSVNGDYLHLRAPVVYCDEMESEDFYEEADDTSDFYQEQSELFNYFLQANRCAGRSRGLCIGLDDKTGAILLACKALCSVLTENRMQQLVHSLFMIVLQMRVDLFPDEVDPELAQLALGKHETLSLSQLADFMRTHP